MDTIIKRYGLETIAEKIFSDERISVDDAIALYACPETNLLGALADVVRKRKNKNVTTYILNRYINYSNICILNCQFCSFARKEGEEGSFTMSVEEIAEQSKKSYEVGVREVHIVGGLHAKLPWEYYTDMLSAIKTSCPEMLIKAFTAVEIRHFARRIVRKPIAETLEILKAAGLDSLTGGGAEIFDPEIRDKICKGKETSEEWCEVHRLWHKMGMKSTCTMLYGHLETPHHRVKHLETIRNLQDETGGFTGFIPFAFEPENNQLSHCKRASANEDLRNIALSRLFLDNIDHITAYWISMGLPIAQTALHFGADDIHGVIEEEKIFHMAGSKTPAGESALALENAITQAGFTARRRNTFYQVTSSLSTNGR